MSYDSNAHIARQLSKFEDLWLEACHSWPPTGFTVDTNTKLTWTITASISEKGWDRVSTVIADLADRWPWHAAYSIPQLHVTIAGLGHPQYWNSREEALKLVLEKVLTHYSSINVRIHGLNILRNTVVVQIVDLENNMRTIVEQLAQLVKDIDPDSHFRPGIHAYVWWASIVRLHQPISDDVIDFVHSQRQTEFATTSIESIQLIETTKGSDLSKTRIIAKRAFSQ